jgi:acetyl esterase/lipase
MKRLLLFAFSACLAVATATAQTRYLDEVFSQVQVTSNVVYGQNITVLTALQGLPPSPQNLLMDVYRPVGDTETERPLLLYFHTGNFLPQYMNGSPLGTKTDSAAVEICTRYAKMGYVVASVDYRLGRLPRRAGQPHRGAFLPQVGR